MILACSPLHADGPKVAPSVWAEIEERGRWVNPILVRNLTKRHKPAAYLANSFAGATNGGIRALPVGSLTARVVCLAFDASF
ncbi:hypothetical protein IP81_18735 [Novosphingobium sp. AAP83]|nr:hypothetical protein IP81_18735 [Novosphingobium sp. AAP83]